MIKLHTITDTGKEFKAKVENFLNDKVYNIISYTYTVTPAGGDKIFITYKDVAVVKPRKPRRKTEDNPRD